MEAIFWRDVCMNIARDYVIDDEFWVGVGWLYIELAITTTETKTKIL